MGIVRRLVVCLLLVPFAAVPARAAEPAPPRTLTVGTLSAVDSMSPFLAIRALPTAVFRHMYDFLTNYDPKDGKVIPALAESWSASDDKLTWTYRIRSGATWSDGRPVTAKDAAWTFNLIKSNKDAGKGSGSYVKNFRTVTATDDRTLVIVLNRPQSTMLALDVPIVPEHVWAARVPEIGKFNNDTRFPVVGNGPFVLTDYRKSEYIELTANKDYWRGAPKFDKVVYRYFKDIDAEVEALKKGEIDFVSELTPAQYESLRGNADLTLNKGQGKRFYALAVNPGPTTTGGQAFGDANPALKDRKVRHALARAIDTKALVDKTLGGHGTPGGGYLPPIWTINHWEPDDATRLSFDLAAANRLLDGAGYAKGGNGMRTTPDGKPFSLRILGVTSRAPDTQNSTFMKEWFKQIGVELVPSIVESGTQSATLQAGNYDLAFTSWSTNPDPDYVLALHTCGARPATPGSSYPGDNFVCVAAYDELYQKQLAEYDANARTTLIKQAQRQLYTDAYINVLYYPNVLEAFRKETVSSMQRMPGDNGTYMGQDGYWAWWSAMPTAATGSDDDGGGATVPLVVGAAVLLGAAVVGFLVVRRRRSTADERE
ncbi:ABC transporter substrate-binding protein [Virgisporangium ochraceum]|uniref:ABC transporter substrate-binding protein n=1 Tax=Virgisporangium ochraceum TaxID=65505 RepID=A0A8J4A0Q6_9ACTN|nr:ABC transporter substrate-binding protein [Virgisporangium ochraceum]GIJ73066.1 ABC transporter substrate-binding protein [Virgisporangium ochraceum]